MNTKVKKLIVAQLLWWISTISVNAQINFKVEYLEHLIPYMDGQMKWGYMEAATGKTLVKPTYDEVDLFEKNGIAKVAYLNPDAKQYEQRLLYGWIDTAGKEIFPPQFSGVYDVKLFATDEPIPDYREVYTVDGKNGIISLSTGKWVIPLGHYERLQFYTPDTYVINNSVLYQAGKKYQAPPKTTITNLDFEHRLIYITKDDLLNNGVCRFDGQIILPANYIEIQYEPKAQRFLATQADGNIDISTLFKGTVRLKVLLFDEQGNKISNGLKSDYNPNIVNDTVATYQYNDKYYYFHLKDGSEISEEDFLTNTQGYYIFQENDLYGIKDADKKIIVPAKYYKLKAMDNHLFLATSADNYALGVIDKAGKQVIPFAYKDIDYWPLEKSFIVSNNNHYGLLDISGKTIIPLQYDYYFLLHKDRAIVGKNGKKGVIDIKGNTIIPAEYDEIFDNYENDSIVTDNYYRVSKNGYWGLMDTDGKLLLPIRYGYIMLHNTNKEPEWISTEDATRQVYGLYNLKTKLEIVPQYKYVTAYNHFIIAKRQDKDKAYFELLDTQGKLLTDQPYSEMEYYYGYLSIKLNGKQGIMGVDGKTLIEPKYNYIWPKTPHLVLAQDGDRYVYVDLSGKEYR